MSLLDALFPPSGDMLTVRNASPEVVLSLTREQNNNGIVSLSSYQNEIIRALVHEAKFHGSSRANRLLATVFDAYIQNHIDDFDVVIPLPLSSRRKRERGFNQVTEILFESRYRKTLNISEQILVRSKHTAPQTSLEKTERFENMKNSFRVHKADQIKNKHVLVVDDVTTTGATLRSARTSLIEHNPNSITLLALAH